MATFKQTFRVPLPAGSSPVAVERIVKAVSTEQAFRIAQGIAKANNWAASGQPVKVGG